MVTNRLTGEQKESIGTVFKNIFTTVKESGSKLIGVITERVNSLTDKVKQRRAQGIVEKLKNEQELTESDEQFIEENQDIFGAAESEENIETARKEEAQKATTEEVKKPKKKVKKL